MNNLPKNEKLIPVSEIIRLAKERGYAFGFGDPYNRIRYYVKIGIIPNMVRRTPAEPAAYSLDLDSQNKTAPINGTTQGHLPAWVVDRLLEIQELKNERAGTEEIIATINSHQKSIADSIEEQEESTKNPIASPTENLLRPSRIIDDLYRTNQDHARTQVKVPSYFLKTKIVILALSLLLVSGGVLAGLNIFLNQGGKPSSKLSSVLGLDQKSGSPRPKPISPQTQVLAARTTPSVLEINTDVGISGNLNLTGAMSITDQLEVSNASKSAISLTGNSSGITLGGSGNHEISTLGSSNLILNPGGNIGLGVLSPTYKLDVKGDTNLISGSAYRIGGNVVLDNSTLGSSVTNSSLTKVGALSAGSISDGFGKIDVGSDDIISTSNIGSAGNTKFLGSTLDLSGKITSSYGASDALSFTGSGAGITFSSTGKVTVTSGNLSLMPSGNVGVGSLTPTAKLYVEGTDASVVTTLIKAIVSQTANVFEVQASSGGKLLQIDAFGNVSIGVTTP